MTKGGELLCFGIHIIMGMEQGPTKSSSLSISWLLYSWFTGRGGPKSAENGQTWGFCQSLERKDCKRVFLISHYHLLFFFFLPLFFFGLGEFPTDDSEVDPWLPIPMALALMPPPPRCSDDDLASSSNLTFRLVVIFFLDLGSQNAKVNLEVKSRQ